MDEAALLHDLWHNQTPYNRAADDKWRSYIVDSIMASFLGLESDCVTVVNGQHGLYCYA